MDEVVQLRQTIKELLENLCNRIDVIVELYNLSDHEEANNKIAFLSEDMISLARGISVLKKQQGLNISIEELNTKLTILLEQYESRDYTFVSDLLKYEIRPLFELWNEEISYEQ